MNLEKSADAGEKAGKMRAAVIEEPKSIRIANIDIPEPGSGEVRVRLEGCGVCVSNLPVWEGRPWFRYPMEPGAPGHEGWGIVDRVGADVVAFAPGDRVTFLSGHAYAEYDIVSADSVVTLPSHMAGPFPGEPLGCAMNIFYRSGIRSGNTVAVVGAGFLGLILTALAHDRGAQVIVLSRRPFALETARGYGADLSVLMDNHGKVVQTVRDLTGGNGCDIVIETTGYQQPLDLAAELTGVRGRLVIAGYHQDGSRQVNMQLWNWRGLDVINAHERDSRIYLQGIQEAISAVAGGLVDPQPLYTHIYPLDELQSAFQDLRERPDGFIKALMTV